MTYWHMQMHPDNKSFAEEHIYSILEHKKVVGLGQWNKGKAVIEAFQNEMQVNDVLAIKNGAKLIALVQIVGGAYEVCDDDPMIAWIEHRRPIRILDWELDDKTLPQPRGTLVKCVNSDAPTTKVISDWYKRVVISFGKRKLSTTV